MNTHLRNRVWQKYRTQADFAMALKICESVVSRVVHQRQQLPVEEQQRWANALDCCVEDIFKVDS